MDVPLLRTMTEKSVLGFGKYSDCRVGDLINVNKTRYLRWCYFNLEKINFTEDVMTKIKLLPDFKIDKPGKNPDKGKELDERYNKMRGPLDNLCISAHSKRRSRAQQVNRNIVERKYYSKGSMQSRNQGH